MFGSNYQNREMMKVLKKFFVMAILIVSFTVFSGVSSAKAACYDLINFYSGWGYGSNYKVNINYTYQQNGSYYYGYRILLAEGEWESEFGLFNMNEVSSGGNMKLISDTYGDTGWVGRAYYLENPKRILINEWYQANRSYYDYTAYTRTIIHEMGHTHGLDHTSCVNEVMSNSADKNIYQTNLGDGDRAGIKDKY
jgi:hypothetical protein